MKRDTHKLLKEIEGLQFVGTAEICSRGAQPLCVVQNETINKQIFTSIFQSLQLKRFVCSNEVRIALN